MSSQAIANQAVLEIDSKEPTAFERLITTVKRDWQLYLLLFPMIIWFALWVYQPIYGVLIAFRDFSAADGVMGSPFVGLSNFNAIFFGLEAQSFWLAFRNTFLISLYGLCFGFPIPIILALLFSEVGSNIYRNAVQTVSYLPHFISEVIITGMIITMLSNEVGSFGVLAQVLQGLGVTGEGQNLLDMPEYFRPMFILTGIWRDAGYGSIVYFAAIMGISPVLYEALKVDGGNKLQEIRFVTFPGMAPTLVITLILRIGSILSVGFERTLLLQRSATLITSDVISTWVFRMGLYGTNQALGAAGDLFNSLIGLGLVLVANTIARKASDTALW